MLHSSDCQRKNLSTKNEYVIAQIPQAALDGHHHRHPHHRHHSRQPQYHTTSYPTFTLI